MLAEPARPPCPLRFQLDAIPHSKIPTLPNGVPMILHQTWRSHELLPQHKPFFSSWDKFLPDGWIHVLWTDEEVWPGTPRDGLLHSAPGPPSARPLAPSPTNSNHPPPSLFPGCAGVADI